MLVSRYILTITFAFLALSMNVHEARAQTNPSQIAPNEVALTEAWRVTAPSGDGDDYWLIFRRNNQDFPPHNRDETDIRFDIVEPGPWSLALTVESDPTGCVGRQCRAASIVSLTPMGNDNRWRLIVNDGPGSSNLLELQLDRLSLDLALTAASVDFGDVVLGNERTLNFTLTNRGAADVTFQGADDCGDPVHGRFQVDGNIPFSLSPGRSRSFSLIFRPGTAGAKQCQISFTSSRVPSLTFRGRGIPTSNTLSAAVNQDSYGAGQTMALTATLTALDTPGVADAYIVVQLPDGQFLSLQLNGGLVPGLVPIARNFTPFSFVGELTRYTFTGAEPRGTYTWLSALTRPGTLTLVGPLLQTAFTVP